jgi:TRAP transporter 4TM/12TM fusion protein
MVTLRIVTILASLLTMTAVLWAADLAFYLDLLVFTEQFLAFVLGLTLALVFLSIRLDGTRNTETPWYDYFAALLGLISAGYVALIYPTLADELAYTPLQSVVLSSILLVLIVEAVRRAAGTSLAILIALFIAYGLFGHLLPGQLAGRNMRYERFVTLLVLDPNGVLGTPLKIGATIVAVFVLFGSILSQSGGTEFFTNISSAVMGRYRGGSAKISIVASALFGSVSGSAVSNVATTGIVTIPLMRRAGFPAKAAGGIEAVASTGGQLMPPVMGASAFLMAEFLEISYAEVVYAALVPAFLYFFALLIQADLRAARDNIKGVPDGGGVPSARSVLAAGWIYPVPFVVLISALFWLNVSPQKAGLYAIASILLLIFLRRRGNGRSDLKTMLATIPQTGHSVLDVIVITAAAGMVIGVLNFSGLSFGLTLFLVNISEHSVFLLLAISAIISIILGMGMPTVGVYVLLAALVAPSLIQLGFDKISVHLFILYFGMMSMITPPIAIAAFAAAGLAKADPMATGWEAMKFGWIAYVIPFVFILSPGILLQGDWAAIAYTIPGVWFGSIAAVGYFAGILNPTFRACFVVLAIGLFWPSEGGDMGQFLNWSGLLGGMALLLWLHRKKLGKQAV